MASKDLPTVLLGDLRGGRNGGDSPFSLPDQQVVEAVNMDWYEGLIGRKRGGSDSVSLTGVSFTGPFNALFRHVPGNTDTAAELWAVDGAATPVIGRLAGGTTWASVTPKDNIATRPQDANAVSFNGKQFMAFDSTTDRLHVWDGTELRRTGLATPAAPSVANTGAGSYSAKIRYYKVKYTVQVGGATVRRSESSATASFTPSGSGTAARVTKPAAISEGETHWELYASEDGSVFYLLATTAVGTTTYDDSTLPQDYANDSEMPLVGLYTNWTSVKFLLTDGNRLLGAGAWESGGKNNRVYFSPVLGSLDVGDDERVVQTTDQKNYIDVNENDGDAITALAGPLQGVIVVFKSEQIYKLIPTGEVTAPYSQKLITSRAGALNQKSVVEAPDLLGNPALYFLSKRGPYRIGINGLEYLGRDVEDLWNTVNQGATAVVGFGIYHEAKNQVWWWVSTGSDNEPDTIIKVDIAQAKAMDGERVRGGWSQFDGSIAAARCAVPFANILGASMSRDLKPYIGLSAGTATLLKADTSTQTDAGTAFRAYLRTKPMMPAALATLFGLGQAYLVAKAATAVTITLNLIRDMGAETRTSSVLLTPEASETYILKKFEAADLSGAWCAQMELGDASAVASAWTLEGFTQPVLVQERK